MTKIGEPSMLASKKRSWSTTLQGHRAPLFQKQDNLHVHDDAMMATSCQKQHKKKPQQQQQRYHPNRPFSKQREDSEFLSPRKKAFGNKAQKKSPPAAPALPASHSNHHQPKGDAADMQSILLRYHSLALAHASAAKHMSKRRRLDSSQRSSAAARRSAYHVQHAKRLEQLAALKKMAADTLEFTDEVIRGEEERFRREMEIELEVESNSNSLEGRVDWDEMNLKAAKEREVAEGLLKKYGIAPMIDNEKEDSMDEENNSNEGGQQHLIGGIPSKFLDLTHFPGLQKQQKAAARKKQLKKRSSSSQDRFLGEKKKEDSHIIDCTEEAAAASPQRLRSHHASSHYVNGAARPPARIPSFGANCNNNNVASRNNSFNSIPQEIVANSPAAAHKMQGKQNTKRIFISHASLSHVNGTYVQEGNYNDAPLFVRVGPPRKFMGKWDCGVVLRRERKRSQDVGKPWYLPSRGNKGKEKSSNGKAATTIPDEGEYVWKIGLVPAHRITHPRIIGYFVAEGGVAATTTTVAAQQHHVPKRVSNMDRMDEDIMDDEDCSGDLSYLEPPADGWRVFQEITNASAVNAGKGNVSSLGRAIGLKVSYVE